MIAADIGRGTMYALMPFLPSVFPILVLSFFIECLSLLWTPARDASLPNLVPRRQLANANSLGLLSSYGTLPLGGVVALVLATVSTAIGQQIPYFHTHTESLALWLDAGTFAFSAYMVSGVPLRGPTGTVAARLDLKKVWTDMKDGRPLPVHEPAHARDGAGHPRGVHGDRRGALARVDVRRQHAGRPDGRVADPRDGVRPRHGDRHRVAQLRRQDARPRVRLQLVVPAGVGRRSSCSPSCRTSRRRRWRPRGWALATGVMWVTGYTLLQENVADEFRGRTFGSITVVSRLSLLLSLTVFPTLAIAYGKHSFFVGGQRIDLSGTRLALLTAGVGVILAGWFTRSGLRRLRLARPKALSLVPKLKRPPATGLFIAFEGVEGAGKGTQVKLLEEYLRSLGHDVLVTREPGGTDLGEQLRAMLLDPQTGSVDARTEALLFAASRSQHVATVIRPALAAGRIVICDRYVDSSLAYQGWARGLGEQDVLTLNVWATQGLFPDLVILLHVEPELGLLRSTEAPDRMELEGGDFHAKVADAFLKIAEEHPERFVVIESDKEPALVADEVRAAAERLLRDRADGNGQGGAHG